ncbi:MAG TPA: hypothetical protein VJ110_03080 [Candidatus Nanoarchaeia archaeon]|nr:hypothetical protein [Candidatus Nanoarchaeia archaeon]
MRIQLRIGKIEDPKLKEVVTNAKPTIRILGHIKLKIFKEDRIFEALIDTGAHISVIPKKIWEGAEAKVLGSYAIRGIVSKKECEVPVKIGKITLKLIDKTGYETEEKEILAYLAETNEVPLILGFRDLLEDFKLVLDVKTKEAYLEDKTIGLIAPSNWILKRDNHAG